MKTAMQQLREHLVNSWSAPGDLWKPDKIIERVESMIELEKRHMRSICDITNVECIELAKIIGGADHISQESQIAQIKELLNGIYTKQTNLPGIKWMRAGKYLNEIGVDPFLPLPPQPPEDRVRWMTKQTTPLPP